MAPLPRAGTPGYVLGGRAYWSPRLRRERLRDGVSLLAPFQTAKDETRLGHRLVARRRRIESVLVQLVERCPSKRTCARDLWHLSSRWLRKVRSHTVAVLLAREHGLSVLSFRRLIAG